MIDRDILLNSIKYKEKDNFYALDRDLLSEKEVKKINTFLDNIENGL